MSNRVKEIKPKELKLIISSRWTEFAKNISQAVKLTPGKGPAFQAGDFAGHSVSNFSITRLLDTDILSGDTGARINTVSQHMYMGDGATGTVSTLLNKSLSRSKLASFKSDIAYANSKGLRYILVSSSLCLQNQDFCYLS